MDKLENFEVVQVVEDEGRDGPQWKLTGLVPWSQFQGDFWIDQKRYPEKPSKGICVSVERIEYQPLKLWPL